MFGCWFWRKRVCNVVANNTFQFGDATEYRRASNVRRRCRFPFRHRRQSPRCRQGSTPFLPSILINQFNCSNFVNHDCCTSLLTAWQWLFIYYFQTRLQAQAAGVPYQDICRMPSFQTNTVILMLLLLSHLVFISLSSIFLFLFYFQMVHDIRCSTAPPCPSGCNNRYKGTLDVLYKVIRQVSA